MESCFGFVAVFLILDVSLVSTDSVFPTEDYPEVDSSTSGKLQNPPLNNCSLSKMKAEKKCDEYAREIQTKTGINCTKDYNDLSECFVDNDKYNNATNDIYYAIIAGEEAKVNELPHMVALGKHNSEKTFTLICGGTLISHTWILTAAHCTYGPNGTPSHARIGFHKLSDRNIGVTISIKRRIRHPDYKPPQMYADIALIELVNAVTFSVSIRPACLYLEYATYASRVWISGWGITEFAGENSDPLLKAQLFPISKEECMDAYKDVRELPHGITSSMICVGDLFGDWKRDTCQGDSGGPVQNPDYLYPCLHRVIGVTSLGLGCAMNNTPGVYTKVSSYVPWIANIVWPLP